MLMNKKLLPLAASALFFTSTTAQTFTIDGFTYTVTGGKTVTLSATEKNNGDIVIPENVSDGSNSYTVNAIGDAVFKNTEITSVMMPESVKSIGNEAFRFCKLLKKVVISEYVEKIGSYAFATCRSLADFNWPKRYSYIGDGAFTYDSSITGDIYVPAKATIEGGAFCGMYGVTSVTLDGKPEFVGTGTFSELEALKEMNVNATTPPSFSLADAFGDGWDEPDLSGVTLYVPVGSKEYYEKDEAWGNCFGSIKEKEFKNTDTSKGDGEDGERTETKLETSVSEDGTEVTLNVDEPGTLSDVLTSKLCKNVKKLTLSDKLNGTDIILLRKLAGLSTNENVNEEAKLESLDLRYVDIKKGGDPYLVSATSSYYTNDDVIGSYFFTASPSLRSIVLPKYVKSLSPNAFYNVKHLKNITFNDNLKSIGELCFYMCNELESVELPDKVEKLGDEVFYACESLKHVGLSKSLRSIPFATFYFCTKLDDITLTDNIMTLDQYAFYNCKSLKSINIPKSVTAISGNAFNLCSSLQNFNVDRDNENYKDIDGVLFNKLGTNLMSYPLGNARESYTIPKFAIMLSENSFWKSTLKAVVMGSNVKEIKNGAFSDCENLESVTFNDELTTIGVGAFSNDKSLMVVNIPGKIEEIPTSCFEYCTSLKTIHLPSSVATVDGRAFAGCVGLEKVIVDATVPPICYYEDDTNNNTPFDGVDVANCKLVVPEKSVDDYKKAMVWKNFNFSSTDGVYNNVYDTRPVATEYTDIQGRKVNAPSNGIFIEKNIYSDGSCKITKRAY